MAFDEDVAARVRKALKTQKGITERMMFGGIAFMLNGHMICGVLNSDLVLRLGKEQTAKALNQPHTRNMDFTGRVLKSMIYVSPKGFESDRVLQNWLKLAITNIKSLPPR